MGGGAGGLPLGTGGPVTVREIHARPFTVRGVGGGGGRAGGGAGGAGGGDLMGPVGAPDGFRRVVGQVAHPDRGALGDRRPRVVLREGREGRGHHQVQGRLEFAAQSGPDLGERTGLRLDAGHRQRHRQAQLPQGARQFGGRQQLAGQQGGEDGGQQPVFVLRRLRPRRHQVRQPEPARWLAAPHHDVVLVAHRHLAALPPGHVLPDVVQVGVDRGGVAAGRPVPGRCLEGHVDARTRQRAAAEEALEDLVHLVDHARAPALPTVCRPARTPSVPIVPRGATGPQARRGRRPGRAGCPRDPKGPPSIARSVRCSLPAGHRPRRARDCADGAAW